MPAADHAPTFAAAGLPLSVLVDYDGTISILDVGDAMLARLTTDAAAVARIDAAYDAGLVGSRELIMWDMDALPDDPSLLGSEAAAIPQDETFVELVAWADRHGAAVEVVSDGLGFYIEAKLSQLGVTVPVATNHNPVSGGGAAMRFPYGHPRCFVCGTCKRERVFRHREAGRLVVFIGDGMSDRFAAAHSDIVFAKGRLISLCAEDGWETQPWSDFASVVTWLEAERSAGRLPRTGAEVDAWRERSGVGRRPFICGPEAWGDGRSELPARSAVG